MYLLSNKVAENASIIQQIVKKLNFVSVTINIPAAKKVNVTIKCIIAGSCKTRPLYIIYLSLQKDKTRFYCHHLLGQRSQYFYV